MAPPVVTRHHRSDGRVSWASYSPCDTYRYALERRWSEGPGLTYIMLNPSKATERDNDPTIERCERRARALGFSAFRAVNLFALRATDPRNLKQIADPIGPGNLAAVRAAAEWGDMCLCAWGVHGALKGQDAEIARLLSGRSLMCLGTTKSGAPRHPLYVPYAQAPIPWISLNMSS